MDIRKQLKTMLHEAELYSSQGLIAEARTRYEAASKILQNIGNIKNKEKLLGAINKKLRAVSDTKDRVEQGPSSAELSDKAQDLIKNLFSFSESKDSDTAALEGAVALAKFGQFDRALAELTRLLNHKGIRVEAAKNILRCHITAGSAEEAIDQYHKWCQQDLFQSKQLELIRVYLEDTMKKRGIEANLPSMVVEKDLELDGEPLELDGEPLDLETLSDTPEEVEPTIESEQPSEDEFIDITSIGITFSSGEQQGQMIEFDVNFQSGNMLSLIIPKGDKGMIENLKAGMELENIQFYSPIAIFNGAGVVSSKTQIKSGPKQGDFCLDIRIVST